MAKHINKTYPLRLPNELRAKVEFIAKSEYRDFSKQYELMINDFVTRWECANGALTVEEDGNVIHSKPTPVKMGELSQSKIG